MFIQRFRNKLYFVVGRNDYPVPEHEPDREENLWTAVAKSVLHATSDVKLYPILSAHLKTQSKFSFALNLAVHYCKLYALERAVSFSVLKTNVGIVLADYEQTGVFGPK